MKSLAQNRTLEQEPGDLFDVGGLLFPGERLCSSGRWPWRGFRVSREDIVPRLKADVPNQPSSEQLEAEPLLSRLTIVVKTTRSDATKIAASKEPKRTSHRPSQPRMKSVATVAGLFPYYCDFAKTNSRQRMEPYVTLLF